MTKTIRNFLFIFMGLAFCMAAPQAFAQQDNEAGHVKITLTPEFSEVRPGETLFVAITQDIEDGWHTYWRNPGDSGEPPRLDWDTPKGFTEGKMHWPVPHRITAGPLTNLGYSDKVTLLQELRIPADIPDGPFEIKAAIDILVCEEICIPEYYEESFILNDGREEEHSDLIAAAFEKMPIDIDWDTLYKVDEQGRFYVDMHFKLPALITQGNQNVKFDVLPYEWGIIDNSSPTAIKLEKRPGENHLIFMKARGDRPLDRLGVIEGIIAFDVKDENRQGALAVPMKPDPVWLASLQEKKAEAAPEALPSSSVSENSGTNIDLPDIGIMQALLYAVFGGLILNLMPCVFPVLSMKALSLARMAEHKDAHVKLHGLAYMAGILLCFAFIAGLLITLQAAGEQIGWGFQLQSPLVVLLLSYLLFVIGLNLSGYFEFSSRIANIGGRFGNKNGLTGSFFTGILAAIVATPCTAPFMGVAMGFAITQPPAISMTVFLALGFGLALPYLMLSFFPPLRSFMPKPGNWMVTFKEFLAFPLYASAAWLIWVYSQQAGSMGLLYALSGFVGIGFTVWAFHSAPKQGLGQMVMHALAIIVLLTVIVITISESLHAKPDMTLPATQDTETAQWADYTPEAYQAALAKDAPVFVNMTAAWCITCKVNEKVALDKDSTRTIFKENNVQYIKGDWTNRNETIKKYLADYGRNGVPLYVYYGPRDKETGKRPEPVILPQLLTPGIIADTIKNQRS